MSNDDMFQNSFLYLLPKCTIYIYWLLNFSKDMKKKKKKKKNESTCTLIRDHVYLTLSSRRAYVRRHKKTIGFGVGRISDALRK